MSNELADYEIEHKEKNHKTALNVVLYNLQSIGFKTLFFPKICSP